MGIDPDRQTPGEAIAKRKREIFADVCNRFGLQTATLRLLPAEALAELIRAAGGPSVNPNFLRKDL